MKARIRGSERSWGRLVVVPGTFLVGVAVGGWLFGGSPEVEQEAAKEPPAGVIATLAPWAQALQPSPAAEAERPSPAAAVQGARGVSVRITGTIPKSLAPEIGPLTDALSAEVSRLLVWDMDLRRDLRAGDRLDVLYEGTSAETIEILAVRLESGKLGRAVEGYRWRAPGDPAASWWMPDGTEVPKRLVEGPIEGYDQITSLLKDRPRHRGMDFKAAVGTPVTSARAGVVTRTNWKLAANGNCVEVKHEDGVIAKYLHLSRTDVKPGQRVAAGDPIGLSGNTGRSTGPHLHYQLERGKTIVDPLDYHGTDRRALPAEALPALTDAIGRLQAQLPGGDLASL